jgi:hypothetical protein
MTLQGKAIPSFADYMAMPTWRQNRFNRQLNASLRSQYGLFHIPLSSELTEESVIGMRGVIEQDRDEARGVTIEDYEEAADQKLKIFNNAGLSKERRQKLKTAGIEAKVQAGKAYLAVDGLYSFTQSGSRRLNNGITLLDDAELTSLEISKEGVVRLEIENKAGKNSITLYKNDKLPTGYDL